MYFYITLLSPQKLIEASVIYPMNDEVPFHPYLFSEYVINTHNDNVVLLLCQS